MYHLVPFLDSYSNDELADFRLVCPEFGRIGRQVQIQRNRPVLSTIDDYAVFVKKFETIAQDFHTNIKLELGGCTHPAFELVFKDLIRTIGDRKIIKSVDFSSGISDSDQMETEDVCHLTDAPSMLQTLLEKQDLQELIYGPQRCEITNAAYHFSPTMPQVETLTSLKLWNWNTSLEILEKFPNLENLFLELNVDQEAEGELFPADLPFREKLTDFTLELISSEFQPKPISLEFLESFTNLTSLALHSEFQHSDPFNVPSNGILTKLDIPYPCGNLAELENLKNLSIKKIDDTTLPFPVECEFADSLEDLVLSTYGRESFEFLDQFTVLESLEMGEGARILGTNTSNSIIRKGSLKCHNTLKKLKIVGYKQSVEFVEMLESLEDLELQRCNINPDNSPPPNYLFQFFCGSCNPQFLKVFGSSSKLERICLVNCAPDRYQRKLRDVFQVRPSVAVELY